MTIPDTIATITTTLTDDGLSYVWNGPEDAPIAVSRELLDIAPGMFDDMPWPMVRVGEAKVCDCGLEGDYVVYFKRVDR